MVHLALELLCLSGLNQLRPALFFKCTKLWTSSEQNFFNHVDDLSVAPTSNQLTLLLVLPQKFLVNLELFLCPDCRDLNSDLCHLSLGPRQQLPKKNSIPCSLSSVRHTWSRHPLVKSMTESSPGTWVLLAGLPKSLSCYSPSPLSTPHMFLPLWTPHPMAGCPLTRLHVHPFCLNSLTPPQFPLSRPTFKSQFQCYLFNSSSPTFIPLCTPTTQHLFH